MRFLLVLLLVVRCGAQGLPDSPSAEVPKQKTCIGPCWDYSLPHPSNWEVVKDPYFYVPTLTEFGFAAWDGWMTVQRHSFCEEANNDLGRNPSVGEVVGINLLIEGVVTGLRFGALKAVPKGRASWMMRGLSVGMASISVARHGQGVYNWYHSGCL